MNPSRTTIRQVPLPIALLSLAVRSEQRAPEVHR